MKDYQALFETIDSLNDEFVSIWEKVCNILVLFSLRSP